MCSLMDVCAGLLLGESIGNDLYCGGSVAPRRPSVGAHIEKLWIVVDAKNLRVQEALCEKALELAAESPRKIVAQRTQTADPRVNCPMCLAAIDIGSNTVHLVVVEPRASGHVVRVLSKSGFVGLGRIVAKKGMIPPFAVRIMETVLKQQFHLARWGKCAAPNDCGHRSGSSCLQRKKSNGGSEPKSARPFILFRLRKRAN